MQKTVQALLSWYKENKRPLPWRDTGNAYYVLLSEIMLQQTRIEAVKKYFDRFITALPDIKTLAECEENTLLKLWEGLGYYSRAKNLKKAAEKIVELTCFPETKEELLCLPGIGEYTAGAVSSIAFGKKACAIDGNVLRVLSRFKGKDITKKEAEEFLLAHFPSDSKEASSFTQSWMELGETLCIPKGEIQCSVCPLKEKCIARKKDMVSILPTPKEKKAKKTVSYTVLLLEYDNTFAVRKRPANGLLASLWEFPMLDGFLTGEEIKNSAFFPQETQITNIAFLYDTSHIFTHIKWEMHCYHIKLSAPVDFLTWISREEMDKKYSIPSAFRKVKNSACNSCGESVY